MDNIFDEEEFKKEQEDANFKKGLFGALGTVAQGFSNVPSSHELLYGGKSYRPDVKGSFDALAKGVEDPSERRAKLYADFKGHKEMLESKKKDAEDALLDNRESTRTKSLLQFGKQRGMQIDEKTTGRDVLAMFDPKKIHESEADFERQSKLNEQKYKHDTQQGSLDRQSAYQLKNMEEQQKIAQRNSPNEKLKNLSGTDKARFDNAQMVLKAIDEMGAALDSGDNTFSMIGDNNYTAAAARGTEAYGRMQSGGAINKDEESRFDKTLPGKLDSKEMQRKKLITQREEMISRLKTLGFSTEDISYQPKEFKYGKTEESAPQFEADVIEYAAKHGMSPQAAQNIKEQRNSKRAGL